MNEVTPTNFIEEFINKDLAEGVYNRVQTRFPPEPNGYLHVGHAKAICVDFGTAEKYGGVCNLRLDDTNPTKEDTEYVDAIIEDIKWLGFKIDNIYYASDYFDVIYDCAVKLIEQGKAYVDDLNADEIREYRGTLKEAGKNSPYRDRSVEENLDLFRRMTEGEFDTGEKVLRAKIDMASPNMNMRDPIIYRILKGVTHHRTGDKWCVYPMYDFAHPLSDAAEKVTHSLCTLEFEDHRPLYDWPLKQLDWQEAPRQIEFARMNLSYTVTSKRRCLRLVKDGLVDGWDDPRMATLCGMRRRGYPAAALRDFVDKIGVSKANSVIDYSLLESCVRDNLNENADRTMAVLDPVKVIVDNYPDGKVDEIKVPVNPNKPELGDKTVYFTKEIYIERSDFSENPPKGFFRLTPDNEVRLKGAYYVRFCGADRDENGEITAIHVTYDPESFGGETPDKRKVKGTLHWISAEHCVDAEVRLYDRLFNVENPSDESGVNDFTEHLNENSMVILNGCKVGEDVAKSNVGDTFQFMRQGYFCKDTKSTDENIIINRVVALKDSWKK
ncbi:MAG: glutamine--tRNA ligase/YqeY domain fusion protein [Acutalibacteraceae bacterium]|nr:glutamine--tRNA ligase/YqeY domain fusion protein [Clostridia bacterium]MEE1143784.1 glutamine--tRNA ligase/YqeY domain fusion protein [Acutalibacteraceae bacterium]